MSDTKRDFDVADWFWIVGGDGRRLWSSAAGEWRAAGDPAVLAFLAAGGEASRAASEEWLFGEYLPEAFPAGLPYPPLEPYQWEAVLDISGLRETAEATISALPEPDATVAAKRMRHSKQYRWDDPLLTMLVAAAGLDIEQVGALWRWAKDL